MILGNVIQIHASFFSPPSHIFKLICDREKLLQPHRARLPLYSIPSLLYDQPSSLWTKIGIRSTFGKNCVHPTSEGWPLNASGFTARKGQHPERREIPLTQLGREGDGVSLGGRNRRQGKKKLMSVHREET